MYIFLYVIYSKFNINLIIEHRAIYYILDGFHKKVSVELGGLKCDRDEMEFAHQFFCKGHPYLVEHIKRKVSTYY